MIFYRGKSCVNPLFQPNVIRNNHPKLAPITFPFQAYHDSIFAYNVDIVSKFNPFFHQPRPNSVLISSTPSIPIIVFHSVFIRPWNISIKYFSFDHVWKTEVKRSVMRFLVVMDCRKSAIEIRKNIHTRFNTLIEFKLILNDLILLILIIFNKIF